MEETNSNFNLVQSFYIDDGQLKNLSPQQIFVLGYEFCDIFMKVEKGEYFSIQFHSDNEYRIRKMLSDQGIGNYNIIIHDDWPILTVFENK